MANSSGGIPPSLTLDGSFGEGGGSILRVAAGLACVQSHPLKITNIRANRTNPGLRLQHLVGIQALAQLTGGATSPVEVGSAEVEFWPGPLRRSPLRVDIRTAGSVGLFSQTIQNGLLLLPPDIPPGPLRIDIHGGGTFGTHAPSPEYLNHVTYALFRQMGYEVSLIVRNQGFFPKGGAQATLSVLPQNAAAKYRGLLLPERGELVAIQGTVHAEARLEKPHVAERIIAAIQQGEKSRLSSGVPVEIAPCYSSSLSMGVGVDLWATFSSGAVLGIGTALGERGVSSEQVGQRALSELVALLQSSATVDAHASDQILPLVALSPHASEFVVPEITSHFSTNLAIIEHFLGRKYSIEKSPAGFLVKFPDIDAL